MMPLHKGVEGQMAWVTTVHMEKSFRCHFRPERHADLNVRVGRIQFVQPEERAQNEIIRCYHEDFLPIHGEKMTEKAAADARTAKK